MMKMIGNASKIVITFQIVIIILFLSLVYNVRMLINQQSSEQESRYVENIEDGVCFEIKIGDRDV